MTVANINFIFVISLSSKNLTPHTKDLAANCKASTTIATAPLLFKYMSYILYSLCFKNKKSNIEVLINSGSELNALNIAYAKKLGFQNQITDVDTQKIDNSSLTTYKIVIVRFQVLDKLARTHFFLEIFLLSNTSVDIILEMVFLVLSNIDVMFADW